MLDGAFDLPFRPERREVVVVDRREALSLGRQGVQQSAHLEGGQRRHRVLNAAEAFEILKEGAPALRGGAGGSRVVVAMGLSGSGREGPRDRRGVGAKAVNHKKRLTRGARDGINCLGRSWAVCRGPLTSFPSMDCA